MQTEIDRLRAEGVIRENAFHWAMQTAVQGEDAMAILARAQLYEEYLLPPESGRSGLTVPRGD